MMSYREFGSGFPVILGGSYLWGREMWAPQIAVLSQHYRVILPELPGHDNDFELPEACRTPADMAGRIGELVDVLGIDQYALIGLSVGGMWAAELALQRAEQVRSLVLMGTYLGAEPAETQQRYFGMLDTIERLGCIPEGMVEQIASLFFRPGLASHEPIRVEFAKRLRSWPRERLLKAVVPLGRLIFGRPDRLDALHRLDRDTTLILAGEHDIPRPPSEALTMSAVIGCSFQTIPNAGHISTLENPGSVSSRLSVWLRGSL